MPRHLTLTELLLNLLLAGGVGWCLGGWRGLVAGAGLVGVLLARAIVVAVSDGEPEEHGPAGRMESQSRACGVGPDAEPGARRDDGGG